jgi:type III secretion protein N (ATPase)
VRVKTCGRATRAAGSWVYARMPGCASVGDEVRVSCARRIVAGRISSFDGGVAAIAAFDALDGIASNASVETRTDGARERLGCALLGRAIDAAADAYVPYVHIDPRERVALHGAFYTGVRVIDEVLAMARGARVGIFGAPGAGMSTLLRSIVRGARADAVVVGSVGERGRESERWIRECDARTTVVCASGDCAPARRVRAADLAFAQAHALRERGLHVLLVIDSLARYANALREVAIAAAEPVGRGGFPPSVFTQLARAVEIAGATRAGTITLIATVLDDGDGRDPVSDAARSLLDGHIVLSPQLAGRGHFPAIDVPASASRTANAALDAAGLAHAAFVRTELAWLERSRDARELGMPIDDERWERASALLDDLAQPADT